MITTNVDDRGVLHIRLDRAEKRNAIDDDMMHALIDAFDAAATDDQVRAILLEGNGEHFCAGADIVARNADADATKPRVGSIQRRVATQAHRLIMQVCTVQVPVVCKVRGWAAGIGFHLALAADFTIAADDATFWEPFRDRGFTPDSGATWLLPRRVGEMRARELLLLGRRLTGREAAEWSAIYRAVLSSELDDSVEAFVTEISEGPTVTLGLTKWLLHEGASISLAQHLPNEAFALELSSRSVDFREGLAAMHDRRAPRFEGR